MDNKKGLTVLVVDENPSYLKCVKKILTEGEIASLVRDSFEEVRIDLEERKLDFDVALIGEHFGNSERGDIDQFIDWMKTLYPDKSLIGMTLSHNNIPGVCHTFCKRVGNYNQLIEKIKSSKK